MVQLQRTRRSSTNTNTNRETIELCVVGPKSILQKTVTVETYLSNTWLTFFNKELKLNVPLNQGIFVCNTQYCPTDPKEGEGWRCNLNEPVSNFVNKFERKRNKFTVRIVRPCDFSFAGKGRASTSPTRTSRTPRSRSRARSSTPGPNGPRTRTRSTPGGNRTQRSRSVAPRATSTAARSPSSQRQLRQPSILIATTTTSTRNSVSTGNGVLTPRSQPQQSRYGTRQKRLHDNQEEDREDQSQSPPSSPPPPEIPAKRQRRSRKQIIVPRVVTPTIIKEEVNQPVEDAVPQITNVRSVLKIELPSTSAEVNGQFFDEDDEMETDVSSAEGDSGSDGNVLEGREVQGSQVEEYEEDGQEEGNGGDDFGAMSDCAEGEDEELDWARNGEGGDVGEGEEDDEDDDDVSMCTAVTEEEIQLRREGIQVEDVKSVVTGRMTNFSNAYMLRMKNEVKKLRLNNHWIKNVEKAPLACYFLQELLKE